VLVSSAVLAGPAGCGDGGAPVASPPSTTPAPTTPPTSSTSAQSTTTSSATSTPAPAAGTVVLSQGVDEDTGRPVIHVVHTPSPALTGDFRTIVRVYQDDHVVGQLWFDPGWEGDLRCFFRYTESTSLHRFRAVATPVHLDWSPIPGAEVSSAVVEWPAVVGPGQIVRLPSA
jgi:hypothetical protein